MPDATRRQRTTFLLTKVAGYVLRLFSRPRGKTRVSLSVEASALPIVAHNPSIEALRAARVANARREKSIIGFLSPGVSAAGIPAREAMTVMRSRREMVPQGFEKTESAPGNGRARRPRTPYIWWEDAMRPQSVIVRTLSLGRVHPTWRLNPSCLDRFPGPGPGVAMATLFRSNRESPIARLGPLVIDLSGVQKLQILAPTRLKRLSRLQTVRPGRRTAVNRRRLTTRPPAFPAGAGPRRPSAPRPACGKSCWPSPSPRAPRPCGPSPRGV